MFEVGQMAVCVEDTWNPRYAYLHSRCPVKGEIFTVREVRFLSSDDKGGALLFEEIVSAVNPKFGVEQAFDAPYFRPVRKTSIEELRKLVAPVPRQPVPAE